jgi:hypothetical protein
VARATPLRPSVAVTVVAVLLAVAAGIALFAAATARR